jgi:hypothetical protein
VKDYKPASLQEALAGVTSTDLTLDTSAAEYITTHTIKGMGMSAASDNVLSSMVGTLSSNVVPTALVSSGSTGSSNLALPTLAQGSTGSVALAGFSTKAPVALAVTDKCGLGSTDTPVGQVTPRGGSASNVPFEVPADLPPGTYSIKATQYGVTFCTQPFDVVASA